MFVCMYVRMRKIYACKLGVIENSSWTNCSLPKDFDVHVCKSGFDENNSSLLILLMKVHVVVFAKL